MEIAVSFRLANKKDVPKLIALLADDDIGKGREDPRLPLHQNYWEAFGAIDSDPNNELIVMEGEYGVLGLFQLTYIPYLSRLGSWRCTVESVRIAVSLRGQGIGTCAIKWAIERARQRGCTLIQLTSDKRRTKALSLYIRLGFSASHEGFKMFLG